MKPKQLYIHVGMQKTGTTFLQELCFPQLDAVHLIRKQNYVPPAPGGILNRLAHVANTNPLFLDLDQEAAELNRLLQGIQEDKILISMERLFGNMFFNFCDNLYISSSLKRIFPAARIIVVVRRQDDLLESLYRQCLRVYFCPTVNSFINYEGKRFQESSLSYPSVNARHLNLCRYVRNYAETFGRDSVLALPYEMIKADPQGFLDRLCDFMQVRHQHLDVHRRVHRSYSLASSYIAFLLNRFVRVDGREPRLFRFIPERQLSRALRGDAGGSPHSGALDERISLNYLLEHVVDRCLPMRGNLIGSKKRKAIMDLHRESNERLDREFGLGLEQYGYY